MEQEKYPEPQDKPAMEELAQPTFRIEPHQRRLLEALKEQGTSFAMWYESALQLSTEKIHPNWQSLVAHCLREIVEKLPEVSSVEGLPRQFKTNNEVRQLSDRWHKMIDNSRWPGPKDKEWTGDINSQLRGMLMAVSSVLERFQKRFLRRELQAMAMFDKFNLAEHPLPEPMSKARADRWNKYRDYFSNLSHGQFEKAAPENLDMFFKDFESETLNLLKPPSDEILDGLDAIIEEAEGNDK